MEGSEQRKTIHNMAAKKQRKKYQLGWEISGHTPSDLPPMIKPHLLIASQYSTLPLNR